MALLPGLPSYFHYGQDAPCPSPSWANKHTHSAIHCTPIGCWIVGWEVAAWGGGCKACKRPAMVFLLCDGWLEGCTDLICMRREASKGEKRGLFNEACHPKPPFCTKPHTLLLYYPSLYPFVIPPHPLCFFFISVLPFHFVAFIRLSSLFLSLAKSYTLPSTLLPS